MRTAKNLFARLSNPDHLDRAADLTVRGKRRRPEVAQFLFRREAELARLHEELTTGTYRPGDFDLLFIHDPKPRLIARLPIVDRVLQGAWRRALAAARPGRPCIRSASRKSRQDACAPSVRAPRVGASHGHHSTFLVLACEVGGTAW